MSLTHNGETKAQALPETVYGGSYNWATGELMVTHKLFLLAVKDMNNVEDYPGWNRVDGLLECFNAGLNSYAPCVGNIGVEVGVNTSNASAGRIIAFLSKDIYGLTQSEWKAQYSALICQFVFPLLEPRIILVTPQKFTAHAGNNILSSNCGDTAVTFQADLKKYIDKRISQLHQLGQ